MTVDTNKTSNNEQHTKKKQENGDETTNKLEDENEIPPVPFKKLFTYADKWDILLIVIGSLAAVIHGGAFPVVFVIFGQLTSSFVSFGRYLQCDLDYSTCLEQNFTTINESEWNITIQQNINSFQFDSIQLSLYFVYCGLGILFLGTIHHTCWSLQAASDIDFIEAGIGEKVSITIQFFASAIAGLILGILAAWQLSLVTIAISPVLAVTSVLILKIHCMTVDASFYSDFPIPKLRFIFWGKLSPSPSPQIQFQGISFRNLADAYTKPGSIAEEAISSIRTVTSLGCQLKIIERYAKEIVKVKPVAMKGGFLNGLGFGLFDLSLFGMIGLSFWYGAVLILNEQITLTDFFAFFGVLMAIFNLAAAVGNLEAFAKAKGGGAKVFQIIERIPTIDSFEQKGDNPDGLGEIAFQDVHFHYPSRPDVKILNGLNLKIAEEKTTALVGESGCGKSTVIQLIQRFYDVQEGKVTFGNKEIKVFNIRKHRDMIGVVSQEPVLFATTIADNIRWGREDVTLDEIHEAAKQANAYDFIMDLPQKFDTVVGEGGGGLSGGQKQRVAIARAVVRNPKILLLDEATSALDTESESIVQAALDNASVGRTTVVVAHRLSTIQHADKIVVLQSGKVAEEGTHHELVKIKRGIYSKLIGSQTENYESTMAKTDFEEQVSDIPTNDDKLLKSPRSKSSNANTFFRQKRFKKSKRLQSIRSFSGEEATKRSVRWSRSTSHSSTQLSQLSRFSQYVYGNGSFHAFVDKYDDEDEEIIKAKRKNIFVNILKLNKPEWPYILVGCIAAAIGGTAVPLFSILAADILTVFIRNNPDEQIFYAAFYGSLICVIGVGLMVGFIIEYTMLAKSGVELIIRIREKVFHSILHQDIAFFDLPQNNPGSLCLQLALATAHAQGAAGPRLAIMVKVFTTLAFCLGIAFYYSWKLSLLIIGFLPIQVLGSYLTAHVLTESVEEDQDDEQIAANIARQAIKNIRTVASLTMENVIIDLYNKAIYKPISKLVWNSLLKGFTFAFGLCVIYFAFAAVFRLGSDLVLSQELRFDNVFKVLISLLFGAVITGQNIAIAPDYAEAKASARNVLALINRRSEIDSESDKGISPAHCKGEIVFKSVRFSYPGQPKNPALKRLNLKVHSGETVALVGPSGSGKSTTVQLLQRFYDTGLGTIFLDGVNISELNVSWLRQQMGLVSQEPVLFDMSVGDNIRYGDCGRNVTDDEVVEVAQKANIDSFVKSLPNVSNRYGDCGRNVADGEVVEVAQKVNIESFVKSLPNNYSTLVGSGGSQVSGGQKQRIAIARALLRNPKILLLDEATSALDAESEKIVQSTLEEVNSTRTTIIIAHKLSTVKNADKIFVIENGCVVEGGTHQELLDRKGVYFKLWTIQTPQKESLEASD